MSFSNFTDKFNNELPTINVNTLNVVGESSFERIVNMEDKLNVPEISANSIKINGDNAATNSQIVSTNSKIDTVELTINNTITTNVSNINNHIDSSVNAIYNHIDSSVNAIYNHIDSSVNAINLTINDLSNNIDIHDTCLNQVFAIVSHINAVDSSIDGKVNNNAYDISLIFIDISSLNTDISQINTNITTLTNSTNGNFIVIDNSLVSIDNSINYIKNILDSANLTAENPLINRVNSIESSLNVIDTSINDIYSSKFDVCGGIIDGNLGIGSIDPFYLNEQLVVKGNMRVGGNIDTLVGETTNYIGFEGVVGDRDRNFEKYYTFIAEDNLDNNRTQLVLFKGDNYYGQGIEGSDRILLAANELVFNTSTSQMSPYDSVTDTINEYSKDNYRKMTLTKTGCLFLSKYKNRSSDINNFVSSLSNPSLITEGKIVIRDGISVSKYGSNNVQITGLDEPTQSSHVTTKKYVDDNLDTKFDVCGGVIDGDVSINGTLQIGTGTLLLSQDKLTATNGFTISSSNPITFEGNVTISGILETTSGIVGGGGGGGGDVTTEQYNDLSGVVYTNKTDISNLEGVVTDLSGVVYTNKTDISNLDDVVTDLSGVVYTNKTDISNLEGVVTDLSGVVYTNKTDISNLEGVVTDLSGVVDTNKTDISNLEGVVTDLSGIVDTLTASDSGLTKDSADTYYVNINGDTMEGDLSINSNLYVASKITASQITIDNSAVATEDYVDNALSGVDSYPSIKKNENGNIGIGKEADMVYTLDVSGTINAFTNIYIDDFEVATKNYVDDISIAINTDITNLDTSMSIAYSDISTNNDNITTLTNNKYDKTGGTITGNVGIGVQQITYELDVSGTINASVGITIDGSNVATENYVDTKITNLLTEDISNNEYLSSSINDSVRAIVDNSYSMTNILQEVIFDVSGVESRIDVNQNNISHIKSALNKIVDYLKIFDSTYTINDAEGNPVSFDGDGASEDINNIV
jgi:hypothetical protein